jgi:hypothetical protein
MTQSCCPRPHRHCPRRGQSDGPAARRQRRVERWVDHAGWCGMRGQVWGQAWGWEAPHDGHCGRGTAGGMKGQPPGKERGGGMCSGTGTCTHMATREARPNGDSGVLTPGARTHVHTRARTRTHTRTHTCASSSRTLPCWVLMAACAPLSSCTAASGPATASALPARASPGSAAASTTGTPLSPLVLVSRAVAGAGPSGRPSCRTVENGTRAPEAEADRGRGTVPLLLPGRWLWLMAGAMTEAPSPPPPPPARATLSLRVGVTDRVRGPGRAWDAVTSATGDANRATRGPATPAPPCPALGPSSWGCRVRRGRGVWDAAADSRAPPWTSPWTLTSPSNAEDTSARPARSSWARGTSAAVWEGCPGSAHHPSRPRTHPAHCSRVMPLQDMQTPLAGPRRAGPARPGDALPRARPEPRTGADRGPVEKGASTRPGRGRGPSRDRREGFVELMRRYLGSCRG